MSGDVHGSADTSDWPEEFLLPGDFAESELWSLILVENGLKDANLRPLAEHLRKGFPLPPNIARMIADAIDGQEGSPCRISAVHPKVGPPHEKLHQRNIEIGMEYLKELGAARRGEAKRIKCRIANRFGVSEPTVRNAVAYTRRWLKDLGAVSAGK